MRLLIAAALVVLCAGTARAQTSGPEMSYAGAGTRELVEGARRQRRAVDRSILRYEAVAQERMSAGLRLGSWDRLMYRRDLAARIDWRRGGPVQIEVLGAREAVPVAMEGMQIPVALNRTTPHLAFDPSGADLFARLDTRSLRHPLDEGSAAHYRFRSGDTTTIQLPGGRDIRLIELLVEPRRRDPELITGTFWLDERTHDVVRMVFRLARPYEFGSDDGGRADDAPGWLDARAELTYVTVEFALWDLRWWLPRMVLAEGTISIGSFVDLPLSYERRYGEYEIEGDTAALPLAPEDSLQRTPRRCRPPMHIIVSVGDDRDRREARAEERLARRDSLREARGLPVDSMATGGPGLVRCGTRYVVSVPRDTTGMMTNEYLPGSIWDAQGLATVADIAELEARLEQLPQAPWQLVAPDIRLPFRGGGLRYNRIEALSIGASGRMDLGRVQLDGSLRMGTADRVLNGELGVTRTTLDREVRLGVYRRLAAAYPDERPFTLGKTIGAFLLGNDDGQYFRSRGVELSVKPARTETRSYEIRLYAERQRAAHVSTDFSIAHWLDDEHTFRENIEATAAQQFGTRIALRARGGDDPAAARWRVELRTHAAAGTFDFARPSLELRGDVPLPLGLAGSLEVAGGTSWGSVPIQSVFFLGGTATLRGYRPVTLYGDAFWRTRVELARGAPLIRLIGFTDAGWAGPRGDFSRGRALVSAGLGIGMFDGLVRLEYARALRAPTGGRFHVYLSGTN